jgi:hypothetical protein
VEPVGVEGLGEVDVEDEEVREREHEREGDVNEEGALAGGDRDDERGEDLTNDGGDVVPAICGR